jgi:hypothetical protein
MKTLSCLTVALCMSALSLGLSEKAIAKPGGGEGGNSAENKSTGVFIDRYFAIKDTKKDMKDYFSFFAASSYPIEVFLGRFDEIKTAYPEMKKYFGSYAGSEYNLEDYLKRFNEIKAAYPKQEELYGYYAGSKWPLEKFVERYYQIKDSYAKLDNKVYGAYAGGYNNLEQFMERYHGIKASFPKYNDCHAIYAAGSNVLMSSGNSNDPSQSGNNTPKSGEEILKTK